MTKNILSILCASLCLPYEGIFTNFYYFVSFCFHGFILEDTTLADFSKHYFILLLLMLYFVFLILVVYLVRPYCLHLILVLIICNSRINNITLFELLFLLIYFIIFNWTPERQLENVISEILNTRKRRRKKKYTEIQWKNKRSELWLGTVVSGFRKIH